MAEKSAGRNFNPPKYSIWHVRSQIFTEAGIDFIYKKKLTKAPSPEAKEGDVFLLTVNRFN
jgi:hypothetical protein